MFVILVLLEFFSAVMVVSTLPSYMFFAIHILSEFLIACEIPLSTSADLASFPRKNSQTTKSEKTDNSNNNFQNKYQTKKREIFLPLKYIKTNFL